MNGSAVAFPPSCKEKDLINYRSGLVGGTALQACMHGSEIEPVETQEYLVKVASSVKESTELIEAGFEYVTEMDGARIFRKRK